MKFTKVYISSVLLLSTTVVNSPKVVACKLYKPSAFVQWLVYTCELTLKGLSFNLSSLYSI